MSYDHNNIFAKIIRGEIPAKKIHEDEWVLSFYDLYPKRRIHALVIPKGAYIALSDFTQQATTEEIIGFWQGVETTIKLLQLLPNGYRLVTNNGAHGHQEVPHFHVHILGGEPVGKMVSD